MNVQDHRWRLGLIDNRHFWMLSTLSCIHKSSRRSLGPIETCNSCPNQLLFCIAQNYRVRAGTYGDLQFRSLMSHCCECSKPQMRDLGPMETSISDAKVAVLHAQNDWWCLGPIETSDSAGPKSRMFCMHKTDRWWSVTHRDYAILVLNFAVVNVLKPLVRSGTNRDL